MWWYQYEMAYWCDWWYNFVNCIIKIFIAITNYGIYLLHCINSLIQLLYFYICIIILVDSVDSILTSFSVKRGSPVFMQHPGVVYIIRIDFWHRVWYSCLISLITIIFQIETIFLLNYFGISFDKLSITSTYFKNFSF